MKSVLGRSILALTLTPVLLQAQSVNVTRTTLRLFEQSSGFVLGSEQRVYTYYYNTLRTRLVAVEATMEYAAAASTFQLSVGCQMTRPDGKVVDGIWKIGVTITAGSPRAWGWEKVFRGGREGWR